MTVLTMQEAREMVSVATRRYNDLRVERDQLTRKATPPGMSLGGISTLQDTLELMKTIDKGINELIAEINVARNCVQEIDTDPEIVSEQLRQLAANITHKYASVEFSPRTYTDKLKTVKGE